MDQEIRDKIARFFDSSSLKTRKKGQTLTFGDEDPEYVTLLVEGVVEQYDITPEGNKITVNMFKPGAFFPMSWAINRTPNTYFFAALTDIKFKTADANQTVEFLRDNPDVTFNLLSRVYKGTDALLKRLVLAASGIAASRLIFELLIEAYRFGQDDDGEKAVKAVKVKQSNLAARSGLARETVSRELHKLEAEGLLKISPGGIAFDINQLEKRLDINV